MRLLTIGLIAIIVLLTGGMVVIATMPMAPAQEKVEKIVPDHDLPH